VTEAALPGTQHGFNVAHGHGGEHARSSGAHRGSSLHRFASFDVDAHRVPTGREEEWRFTPLRRLRGLHDAAPFGEWHHALTIDAAPEVDVQLTGPDDPRRGASGYVPVDRVSARAWANADTTLTVTIAKETTASRPTVITVDGKGLEPYAAGHVVVQAEPFGEAIVVVDHRGSAVLADNVELVVHEGAHLTYVSVQDWADDAVHASHHHIRVGRDATVKHIAVSFGGDVVRVFPTVSYDSTGGDVELLGLYFADAGQHLEHRLFVDHATPRCRSNVLYKGALQGDGAHTVWIGDVLIRPEAVGIETFELNRNLVLTDGTRADSVPNLEIETGEIVGAGHASATGRFDDEQLFYLQSRGIPPETARRLVVRGFFASLITRIGVPELQQRLTEHVERELEETLS
jgi:Fe-S cluster assembly protein SufD